MKSLKVFFPFFICFFTASLAGALFLKNNLQAGLFLPAVYAAAGFTCGLLLFFFCVKKDWAVLKTEVAYMTASAALLFSFVVCTITDGFPAPVFILSAAASAFLFGHTLIDAEINCGDILSAGLTAATAIISGPFLAVLLSVVIPLHAEIAGIAACIFFFVMAFFYKAIMFPESLRRPDASDAPTGNNLVTGHTRDERMRKFAEIYALTAREKDVLSVVVDNECTLKEVAVTLKISERMVQRYMTTIYQKTDTQSRIGLALKYFNESVELSDTCDAS